MTSFMKMASNWWLIIIPPYGISVLNNTSCDTSISFVYILKTIWAGTTINDSSWRTWEALFDAVFSRGYVAGKKCSSHKLRKWQTFSQKWLDGHLWHEEYWFCLWVYCKESSKLYDFECVLWYLRRTFPGHYFLYSWAGAEPHLQLKLASHGADQCKTHYLKHKYFSVFWQ